jgi:DNA-binding transcriptional regulator YiaG
MRNERLEAALARARNCRRLPPPAVRRALREQLRVPQAAIAEAVGVTPAAVSRWESGRRSPRPGVTFEKYLGVLDRLAAEAAGR